MSSKQRTAGTPVRCTVAIHAMKVSFTALTILLVVAVASAQAKPSKYGPVSFKAADQFLRAHQNRER